MIDQKISDLIVVKVTGAPGRNNVISFREARSNYQLLICDIDYTKKKENDPTIAAAIYLVDRNSITDKIYLR
jgi:hypothetical protein